MSKMYTKPFFVCLFLLVFGFTIWPLFDQCLDHLWVSLWVSLRSLLGPLEVLLEASGSKNIKKLMVFQGFWKCSFLALWSSWWLSWAHLAPSLADLVPKWTPKCTQKCSKNEPKIVHVFFFSTFWNPCLITCWKYVRQLLGPKMDQGFCTKFQKDLQEKPRWAQEGHHEL